MVHPKKQPRRCRGFTAYFGQNRENVVAAGRFPVLKVLNFISQIYIISYMRLKFRSLSLLDHQNMPKPIPHCSNFIKIIFLKNGPSQILSTIQANIFRGHMDLLHWIWSWASSFAFLFMWRGLTSWCNSLKNPFSTKLSKRWQKSLLSSTSTSTVYIFTMNVWTYLINDFQSI